MPAAFAVIRPTARTSSGCAIRRRPKPAAPTAFKFRLVDKDGKPVTEPNCTWACWATRRSSRTTARFSRTCIPPDRSRWRRWRWRIRQAEDHSMHHMDGAAARSGISLRISHARRLSHHRADETRGRDRDWQFSTPTWFHSDLLIEQKRPPAVEKRLDADLRSPSRCVRGSSPAFIASITFRLPIRNRHVSKSILPGYSFSNA